MAVIGSDGIKNDSSTIKSQTINFERKAQDIRRPAGNRPMPSRSLPNRNSLSRNRLGSNRPGNRLNRNNNLRQNKDIAKPRDNNRNDDLNPLAKSQQNRRPNALNRPSDMRVPDDIDNGIDGDTLKNPNDAQEQASGASNQDAKDAQKSLQKQGQQASSPKDSKKDDKKDGKDENDEDDESGKKDGGLGKRIKNYLKKHPVVILYIALGAALLFFLMILIIVILSMFGTVTTGVAISESENEEIKKNYGPFFAFDNSSISIVDPSGEVLLSNRSNTVGEYLKGIIYLDVMNMDLSSYSNEEKLEFYKALFVARKAQILKKGNYNNKSQSLILKVTDFNYCDIDTGCKIVSKDGKSFYLSNSFTYSVDSTSKTINPPNEEIKSLLNLAYNATVSMVVTPTDVKEPLTVYKWTPPGVSSSTINSMSVQAKGKNDFKKIIETVFPGYKVYNLDDYVELFEGTYLSSFAYTWPIGSNTPDDTGAYTGDPASTTIISDYGPSFIDQTYNKGIKISGVYNTTKVISPKEGTISYVGTNDKYGTYVILNCDDNVRFLLGGLASGSIKVSANQKIEEGALIGLVGRIGSNTDAYLYVEVYYNGVNVNPNDYISASNPRPMNAKYIKFVQGNDNKQTVCKTFLATGFSKNAVAGLMANIDNESGFKLDNLSDGGTSNGLFQWHKGRLDNLKKYCGAEYLTSIKCQLDFFMYEITETPNAQGGIYNYLRGNHSAYDMGYQFCMRFERPAGGATSANKRGNLAQNTYAKYVDKGCN